MCRPLWIFFCFIPMKTCQSLLVSKDGSKFWSSQTWWHFLTHAKHFEGKCNVLWTEYISVSDQDHIKGITLHDTASLMINWVPPFEKAFIQILENFGPLSKSKITNCCLFVWNSYPNFKFIGRIIFIKWNRFKMGFHTNKTP